MKIRGLVTSALVGSLTLAILSGCMDSLAKQTQKKPNEGIIGKKTDDIKEFDPNAAKQIVSDSKVKVDDPVLYAMQAYGPMVEQISTMYIDHAIDLFHATEDRYPKDYNEFMTRIIKENQIKLPVLPGGAKYAYDVEKHKLRIVKAMDMGPNAPPAPAKN
ncbi:MAG TPA: hypothetical protein VGP76_06190 [Planctomycetaceae bacterium]|jgi:hypothetical protein|nr:hypothetical protein [Planctomycetaceae bacterium]